MISTRFALLSLALALAGCGERRDAADVAAGIGPFGELRGISITALRVGEVRAFRRGAERAPYEGLREKVGDWDLLYDVPNYIGSDGAWPAEDVQVRSIQATREWPTDSTAEAAFDASVREIRAATGATPNCLRLDGPGFDLHVVEFDRGGGWTFAAAFAPKTTLANGNEVSARQSLTVRRTSLTESYLQAGTPNPDDLPTWSRVDCDSN